MSRDEPLAVEASASEDDDAANVMALGQAVSFLVFAVLAIVVTVGLISVIVVAGWQFADWVWTEMDLFR